MWRLNMGKNRSLSAGLPASIARSRIKPFHGEKIFGTRDDQFVGIAAVAMNAEATWLHAEVFIAVAADRTDAAADPGIDEANLADLAVGHIGSDREDLARGLMSEGQRQLDATVLQSESPTAAEIEAAFPEMQVGMTNSGGLDGDHNFIVRGFWIGQIYPCQWAAEIDDLIALHLDLLAARPPDVVSLRYSLQLIGDDVHLLNTLRVASLPRSSL